MTEQLFATDVRLPPQDLARLFRCLVTMVGAGVPVHQALEYLARSEQPQLGRILDDLVWLVENGCSLSAALRRFPRAFPGVTSPMVAAGEATGSLHLVMERLALYLESSTRLRRKVYATLGYPVMLLIVTLLLIAFLLGFVFPREQEMFTQMGVQLPWPTRCLNVAAGLAFHPASWLLGLLLVGIAYHSAGSLGPLWLRLPVLGPTLRKVATARLLLGLSIMLEAGMTLDQTRPAGKIAGHAELERAYDRFLEALAQGTGLGDSMQRSGCFDPLVCSLGRVAEEHGRLGPILLSTARVYEEEAELALSTLATLLEPCILVVMGTTVGGVVVASFLPTLSLVAKL